MIPKSISFNHLALSVKDAHKSAAFYKDVLNLKEITNKTGKDTIRWLSLGGGKELHLITNPDEIKINKSIHFALSISEFDAFVDKLNTNNITYSNFKGIENTINVRPDGIQQVFFQDPNGYWIEVNNIEH